MRCRQQYFGRSIWLAWPDIRKAHQSNHPDDKILTLCGNMFNSTQNLFLAVHHKKDKR
jgi:hypothetical protein